MSAPRRSPTASEPTPVPNAASPANNDASKSPRSNSRAASTARLASPFYGGHSSSPGRQGVSLRRRDEDDQDAPTPLPGVGDASSLPGPGHSALAAAFHDSRQRRSSPSISTPSARTESADDATQQLQPNAVQDTYGSFDQRLAQVNAPQQPQPVEDPEIVRRHLVQPSDASSFQGGAASPGPPADGNDSRDEPNAGRGEFSSLQLQGGDITREVYRWTEEAQAQSRRQRRGQQRSQSFDLLRPPPESDVLDINSIKVPGGFRRNYLRRAADGPPSSQAGDAPANGQGSSARQPARNPRLFTNSFLEFLTLYGHFAGEELEEDDEVLGPDEYFSPALWDTFEAAGQDEDDREPGEESGLLAPGTPMKRWRKRKERSAGGTASASGAALLLLKSFVGTGVLFLPKAFLNGGMVFSNILLLTVALLSYYCFILLVNTRLVVEGSFGDIGGILYGKFMRAIILFSIVISQIGFASAYIVFTSENMQAFVLAVSKCRTYIDIKLMIIMQLIVFLPLSLIRDISKLGATALVADVLILLGLIYLYYYDIFTLVANRGVADIVPFNPRDWTLFIGTAIFTFEGVGLIIPIQEAMKQPRQFPRVLAGVMLLITAVFLSMGALSYAAYGSRTRTVVILNLPQDDRFVNAVQFLYSLAILLSTPLQLFPAIRITENELFTRSGKYNPYIKWQKNLFRFLLVMLCAVIAWGGARDLDKFVALVGSFACVPLVYVYPPLLHLKAVARTRRQRIADIALCAFGVVGMLYTTTLTLQSWAQKPVVKPPGHCDRK